MPERLVPLARKARPRIDPRRRRRARAAYYDRRPDPTVPAERVAFGTSGHRGSSLDAAFNEDHILAITQAICLTGGRQGIDGPLFIGFDTHALSEPAFATRARGARRRTASRS